MESKPLYLADDKEDVVWITVGGRHIPIKPGENVKEKIKSAFESNDPTDSGLSIPDLGGDSIGSIETSVPVGQRNDNLIPADRMTHLEKYEDSIKENSIESAAGMNSSGDYIATATGNENSVDLTDIKDDLKDKTAVFTHNHPRGTGFSPEDIAVSMSLGIGEMRAVGRFNTYIYQPKQVFKSFDINNEDHVRILNQKLSIYNKHDVDVFHEYMKKIGAKQMTKSEANYQHPHEVMRRFVNEVGGYYVRKKTYNPEK